MCLLTCSVALAAHELSMLVPVQTMPLARDQSGVLSVPFSPLTPLHKTLTDVNLAAMAAAAGVRKVCFCS